MSSTPLRVVDEDAATTSDQPHDIQAEQVVLGAAMLAPTVLAEVREVVDETDFYRPAHQIIYATTCAQADDGLPTDPIAVGNRLGRDLTRTGGAPYLHTLLSTVPAAVQAVYYAHIVRDHAYARRVFETGQRLTQLASDPGNDPADLRTAVAGELAALTQTETRGWPEPVPLSPVGESVPFPVEAFPSWLADYVGAVAEETQTPTDLAACVALAVASTAAGGRTTIRVRGSWVEPANLYVVVAMPPASRKSAVFAHMTAPLLEVEKQLAEQLHPQIVEAMLERDIAAERVEQAKRAAIANDTPENRVEVTEAAQRAAEVQVPASPKLVVDDITPEATSALLADQGGRLAVLSPEGGIFSILAGRYSSGQPNLDAFLKGHAGDMLRVDRKGAPPLHIDNPALTLGLAVQPRVIQEMAAGPGFRDKGLLGRFLYSMPRSNIGTRSNTPHPVSRQASAAYSARVQAMVAALHGVAEPLELEPDREALALLLDRADWLEPRLGPSGDLGHLSDWAGKHIGAVARTAGLLQLLDRPETPGTQSLISAEAMQAATTIGDYFIDHALAAFSHMSADPNIENAHAILRWARHGAAERFTVRELIHALRHRAAKTSDLQPALDVLEQHGWVRRVQPPATGKRGRPPAPTYHLNPYAFGTTE